jgi:hypothetical protein
VGSHQDLRCRSGLMVVLDASKPAAWQSCAGTAQQAAGLLLGPGLRGQLAAIDSRGDLGATKYQPDHAGAVPVDLARHRPAVASAIIELVRTRTRRSASTWWSCRSARGGAGQDGVASLDQDHDRAVGPGNGRGPALVHLGQLHPDGATPPMTTVARRRCWSGSAVVVGPWRQLGRPPLPRARRRRPSTAR